MAGSYWYISRAKIEYLRESLELSQRRWLKDLSIKLKSPFAEASAALNLDSSFLQQTERIAERLSNDPKTAVFPNFSQCYLTPFFSFTGHAQRSVDSGAYWIALLEGETALLLAGSISNALGAPPEKSAISPSVDPLGAVNLAFAEARTPEEGATVGSRCGYVWQALVEPVWRDWRALPIVEGIAVYGGLFSGDIACLDDDKPEKISRIVVGSPVYVRQC
jgi:hypothetical protein